MNAPASIEKQIGGDILKLAARSLQLILYCADKNFFSSLISIRHSMIIFAFEGDAKSG